MRNNVTRMMISALLAGFFASYSCCDLLADSRSPTTAPSMDDLRNGLEKTLERHLPEVRFNDTSLKDSFDFLRDITGCNIYVDWNVLRAAGIKRDASVRCQLSDVAFKDCLNIIVNQAGGTPAARYDVIGNVIVISTTDGIKALQGDVASVLRETGSPKMQAKLAKNLPEMRFDATQLSDAIDFLRDVSGANIHVNWQALRASGINSTVPVTIHLRNPSLGEGLGFLLHEVSTPLTQCTISIDGETIDIDVKSRPL